MPLSDRDRFSAKPKREVVLRLLRGEGLDLGYSERPSARAPSSEWPLGIGATASGHNPDLHLTTGPAALGAGGAVAGEIPVEQSNPRSSGSDVGTSS